MTEPAVADPGSVSASPRLLRAFRMASIISMLPLLALGGLRFFSPKLPLPYWTAIVSVILYGIVLWGSFATPPKKRALSLGIFLGSLWFVLWAQYAVYFLTSLNEPLMVQHSDGDLLFLLGGLACLLVLLQGGALRLAWKLCRSVRGAGGKTQKPVAAVVGGGVLGLLVMQVVGNLLRPPYGQAMAVESLRLINTAAITYASAYDRGYSSSLAKLGPPTEGMPASASAAGLIETALASGTKRTSKYRVVDEIIDALDVALERGIKHGYRFDYQPGPPDENGRINSYKVCARPINNTLDHSSYFTDDSGVVRATSEDRCPTSEDMAIGG